MEPGVHEGLRDRAGIVVDVLAAAAVTVVLAGLVDVAEEVGARPADVWAYVLVVAIGAVHTVRRRLPLLSLLAAVGLIFLYHALRYPAVGIALAVALPLFTVADRGLFRPAVAVAGGALAFTSGWLTVGESRSVLDALNVVVREGAVMAAMILAGYAFRSRRLLAAGVRERLRLARAERAAETERRMAEERMMIARELHDVVAHTVTVIGVQARVAVDALGGSSLPETQRALEVIIASTRQATSELRATVGVLRGGVAPSLAPAPGLAQLDSLVARIRESGLLVDVEVAELPGGLPPLVDLTAFRVIQESLTNVLRHASATKARVVVERQSERLVVTVADDGVGSRDPSGQGISGMKERVAAAGGQVGLSSNGDGFTVTAEIPAPQTR